MTLDEIWGSFKAVSYGLGHMGAAVYIDLSKPGFQFLPPMFGKPLIFSGVSIRGTSSTINYAESIVRKILEQEGINITERDFYDLQTWKGYRGFKSGQFVLNKLRFAKRSEGLIVEGWKEIKEIPAEFCGIFYCLLSETDCVNISQQCD